MKIGSPFLRANALVCMPDGEGETRLQLFYTDTRGADIARAICPPGSARKGSAWGRSLLQRAWACCFRTEMPPLASDEKGRLYFPDVPERFVSLSHTEGLAVCVIGSVLVGVDAERPRPLQPGTAEKLMTAQEAADFDFFRLWTLRESYYKCTGRGGMRTPHFWREGERICCGEAGVWFRTLEVHGCPVSLCSTAPVQLQCREIPVADLMREN